MSVGVTLKCGGRFVITTCLRNFFPPILTRNAFVQWFFLTVALIHMYHFLLSANALNWHTSSGGVKASSRLCSIVFGNFYFGLWETQQLRLHMNCRWHPIQGADHAADLGDDEGYASLHGTTHAFGVHDREGMDKVFCKSWRSWVAHLLSFGYQLLGTCGVWNLLDAPRASWYQAIV